MDDFKNNLPESDHAGFAPPQNDATPTSTPANDTAAASAANPYDGVEKCYALQAGREVRVMVVPEKINDEKMVLIARQIAKQIETEMSYPGQVKINLIRESRVVDYAK